MICGWRRDWGRRVEERVTEWTVFELDVAGLEQSIQREGHLIRGMELHEKGGRADTDSTVG